MRHERRWIVEALGLGNYGLIRWLCNTFAVLFGLFLYSYGYIVVSWINLPASMDQAYLINLFKLMAVGFLAFPLIPKLFDVYRTLVGDTANIHKSREVPPEELARTYINTNEIIVYLDKRLQGFENKIGSLSALDQTKQQELLNYAEQSLASITSEYITDQLQKKYGDAIRSSLHLDEVRRIYLSMYTRLLHERSAQAQRAIFNLLIGVGLGVVGLWLLYSFDTNTNPNATAPDANNALNFARQFSVRFSLVLVIEILAFFFLRLYRIGLDEIKYFQNELTNLQSRMLALEAAFATTNKATQNEIFMEMARTERNFVLKKGESTVGIRLAEIEGAQSKGIVSILESLNKQGKGIK